MKLHCGKQTLCAVWTGHSLRLGNIESLRDLCVSPEKVIPVLLPLGWDHHAESDSLCSFLPTKVFPMFSFVSLTS